MKTASALCLGEPTNEEGVLANYPAHTLVTGQSGCGKTTLVARFVEEILLREEQSNVLVFDLNYEFAGFHQVDDAACRQGGHDEENNLMEGFAHGWSEVCKSFRILGSDELKIHYDDLRNEHLLALMGINAGECPDALWLLNTMDDHRNEIPKHELHKAMQMAKRWTEGRLTQDEVGNPELSRVAHEVRSAVEARTVIRLINGASALDGQRNVSRDHDCLRTSFAAGLLERTRFTSIDMLNFDYDRYIVRDLVVLHILRLVWEEAKKRFVERRGREPEKRLYLVVDEAHNIAPDTGQRNAIAGEVLRVIQTIAAEGRKFGLFLVLVTQRPNKIHRDVLSECNNFAVMRSTRPSIDHLKKVVPVRKTGDLDEVCSYEKGQALLCGKFTDYKTVRIRSGIRRTKKRPAEDGNTSSAP